MSVSGEALQPGNRAGILGQLLERKYRLPDLFEGYGPFEGEASEPAAGLARPRMDL
jgi:hypothetical protein